MSRAKWIFVSFSLCALALLAAAALAAPPPPAKVAQSLHSKSAGAVVKKAAPARTQARTGGTKAADVVDQGQSWLLLDVPAPDPSDEDQADLIARAPAAGGSKPPIRGSIIVNPPVGGPPIIPGIDPGTDINVFVLYGDAGVTDSILPQTVKDDLLQSGGDGTIVSLDDGGNSVYFVRQDIADGIAASEAAGELTPEIEAIAEPLDDDNLMDSFIQAPNFIRPPIVPDGSGCASHPKTKSKVIDLSGHNFSKNFNIGDGFSGSFSLSGDLTGTVTAEINFEEKREKLFFKCVPYGLKFTNVHLYGNAATNSTVGLNGTVNYQHSFGPADIIKPELFSFTYWAGIIPITVGFNLPITAGLNMNATTTGSVAYNGTKNYSGTFDWTCTSDDCSGTSNFTGTPLNPSQSYTAGVSGHLKPDAYGNVSLRAYLYSDSIVYVQAGLEPHLLGDLWAYTGNTCGDAEGDGTFESVHALTFDLDDRVDITGQAAILDNSPWKRTFSTGSINHLGFWDLATSTAMSPLFPGPATAKVGTANSYTVKMRPCWPYTDNVTYGINWGDGGTVQQVTGAPATATSASHTWSTPGGVTAVATSLSDQHGRTLNRGTSRSVQVCSTLAISGQPLSASIESGLSTLLSVTSTATAFQWYRGNSGDISNPVAGGTASSTLVTPSATTSYWVRVSNACGDQLDSTAATVTVSFVCHADGQACGGDGNHTCQAGQCVCSNCASGVCCGATGNPYCDGQSHTDPNTGYAGACAAALPSCAAANDFNGSNLFHNNDILACVKLNGAYQWASRRPSPRCKEANAVCDFECSTHYSNGAAFVCDQSGNWVPNPPLPYCNNGTIPSNFSCQVCPVVTSQPQSTSITQGQSATLSVTASGSAPTYQWYRGNSGDTSNPVSGGTGTSITVSPSSTTGYWVRALNTCGPANSQTATVTVTLACVPPSFTSQPQSTTINPGATATLSAAATGTSLFYQWYQGTAPNTSQPVAGGSGATIFVSPSANTSYWVEIWNNCGSLASSTATVTIGCGPDGATCGGDGHHTCQAGQCACTDCNSSVCCGASGNAACDGQQHFDANTGYTGVCKATLASCSAASDFDGTSNVFHNGDIVACVKHSGTYGWVPRRPSPRCQEVSPVCDYLCANHFNGGAGFMCDQNGNWNTSLPLAGCFGGTIPSSYLCP